MFRHSFFFFENIIFYWKVFYFYKKIYPKKDIRLKKNFELKNKFLLKNINHFYSTYQSQATFDDGFIWCPTSKRLKITWSNLSLFFSFLFFDGWHTAFFVIKKEIKKNKKKHKLRWYHSVLMQNCNGDGPDASQLPGGFGVGRPNVWSFVIKRRRLQWANDQTSIRPQSPV